MKRKRPTKWELQELAELSKKYAAAELDPEARRIVALLDPQDRDITSHLSAPEIAAIGRAAKRTRRPGRPAHWSKSEISGMVDECAKVKANGNPYEVKVAAKYKTTISVVRGIVRWHRPEFNEKVSKYQNLKIKSK
jgi:hypothetical protein